LCQFYERIVGINLGHHRIVSSVQVWMQGYAVTFVS
jgi:hypothetical protein